MGFRYAVLGAGRQGTASAYDLGRFGDAEEILLVDGDRSTCESSADKINVLLDQRIARPIHLDVQDIPSLTDVLKGTDSTLSAVPYYFNLDITLAAIQSRSNLCDLGGHTETVRQQLALDHEAKQAGVTITPDCGMGPGLNINMGIRAMDFIDQPEEVFIWDGGLPLNPKPPWNYSLGFHINGLTNEYFGDAWFLRDGKPTPVACLTEQETLNFAEPLGELEAAVTSGGLSTAPFTFQGKLKRLENKTLRYPGHWQQFLAFRELGLFETDPIEIEGQELSPRTFFHHLLEPQIRGNGEPDICVIRTTCNGRNHGQRASHTLELIETFDEKTEFTAMEQLTGWHASIIAILGARSALPKGSVPLERALVGEEFDRETQKRGWNIQGLSL